MVRKTQYSNEDRVKRRLAQICAGLFSEGWKRIGGVGSSEYFRHANGSRMTLILEGCDVAYIRDGRLVKVETLGRADAGAESAPSSALPLT